jgi:ABC-2 type transport system permease protein
MNALFSLIRKNLLESRWMLGALVLALFWLSWAFVFATRKTEESAGEVLGGARMRMFRAMGGPAMDFSTGAIEMTYWKHPIFILMFSLWAIARGSGSVAGELERGTMDLVMSRPVSRTSFVASQMAVGLIGIVLMVAAMVAGNLAGTRYNTLESPPSLVSLSKPAFNLMALAWAIYGYAFMLSSGDIIRWRPTMIASIATLGMYVATVIASLPPFVDWKWIEKFSIFSAYDPVEAIMKAENLNFNAGILLAIGSVGIVLGYLVFLRRDLPAGS